MKAPLQNASHHSLLITHDCSLPAWLAFVTAAIATVFAATITAPITAAGVTTTAPAALCSWLRLVHG
jgi:hypothetical protein